MANERLQLPLVALRDKVVFPNISTGFDAGRMATLYAIRTATDADRTVFVCAQTDPQLNEVTPEDLYDVGTVARIERVAPISGDRLRITCRGLYRARALSVYEQDGALHATVHTWIVRPNEGSGYDVLLQKRSETKDSNPGCYDISERAGGRTGDPGLSGAAPGSGDPAVRL